MATALQAELVGVGLLGERGLVATGELRRDLAAHLREGLLVAAQAVTLDNALVRIGERLGVVHVGVVVLAHGAVHMESQYSGVARQAQPATPSTVTTTTAAITKTLARHGGATSRPST